MNILYISLTRREACLGWALAVPYFLLSLLLTPMQWAGILPLLSCVLILWLFRRFWKETWTCLPLTGRQLLWKPLLACLGAKLVCTVMNDILFFYGLSYYVYTDWGPFLWDIRVAFTAQDLSIPTALTLVVLLPIAEEFLFRGVVMGSIYPKSRFVAILLSTVLFALLHTLPYLGHFDDTTYLIVYFLQYIPVGLLLSGVYINTDTIAAPIMMHMFYNIFILKSAFDYL